MALLFMDSFDHYATADIMEKWTQGYLPAIAAGGRNSTNKLYCASSAAYAAVTCLGGVNEVIMAAAVKMDSFNGGEPAFSIGSATTWECGLLTNADGTLRPFVVNNAAFSPDSNLFLTVIGSSSAVSLQSGVWAYLELRMKCDATTGTCIVRVNGIEVLNLSGLDTLFTSAVLTRVGLGSRYQNTSFDDFVVMDLNGSVNNSFLGDVTISAIYPNGAGATTGWTPSAGSNYDCVNEALVNDDTDYVSTAALTTKDTYDFTNAPAGADIKAVQLCIAARKGAEGPGQLTPVVRSGGTDYDQTAQGIGGTAYSYLRTVLETDPGSGSPVGAWSESAFNAAQFGFKKTG